MPGFPVKFPAGAVPVSNGRGDFSPQVLPTGTILTGTLSNPNRLDSTSSAGVVKEAQIADAVTGGVLSIAATLTTPRALTYPDRSLTMRGVSGTQTLNFLNKFDANGDSTNSAITDTISGNVLTLAGALTAPRTITAQDASGTNALVDTIVTGFKNKLINGNFDIWQRGTSFTAVGYTADRWLLSFGGTAPTLSQQTRVLGTLTRPGKYLLRLVTVAGTTSPTLEQRIENVSQFAGDSLTLSMTRKALASRTVTVNVIQCFGTGGAPSGNVTTTTTINFGTSLIRNGVTVTVPSITGKTLGSNGDDYVSVQLSFPATTAETYDIYDIQAERGTIATDFEQRPPQVELAMCERYFWKTFPDSVTPAQNAGYFNNTLAYIGQLGGAGTFYGNPMNFPVTMRANPTVTFFNPAAANTKWRNFSVPADSGTPSLPLGSSMVALIVANPQQATDFAGNTYGIHLTAESEL